MRTRTWFKYDLALPSSRGMARLSRKFGAQTAISTDLMLRCYLFQVENRIDWNNEDERIDVCSYVMLEEQILERFFEELANLGWICKDLWKKAKIVSSYDVAEGLEEYERAREAGRRAVTARWNKAVENVENS